MQKIIKDFSAINLFFFVISRKMTSQGRSENSDQSGPLHPMLPNADPQVLALLDRAEKRLRMRAVDSFWRDRAEKRKWLRPCPAASNVRSSAPSFKMIGIYGKKNICA